MEEIDAALRLTVGRLSDQNYTQSLDFYRFWFEIGQTYYQVLSDQTFNAIWDNRGAGSMINRASGKIIHLTAHLILRFASDTESDRILAPYNAGLQSRLCAGSLRGFFSNNLSSVRSRGWSYDQYADVNFIAHWANLGYVEEATIRNHILQSLISHPTLYDHQVCTLIILFKLAGATLEKHAEPSVVNRCFELLKNHRIYDPERDDYDPGNEELERLRQVRAPAR